MSNNRANAESQGTTTEPLHDYEEKYELLFKHMLDGFALHEIICDESGNPADYRFVEINPAFEKLTGLAASRVVGKTAREVIPDIEESWIRKYGHVALTGESIAFIHRNERLQKCYKVAAFSPCRGYFVTLFHDITGLEKALKELEEKWEILKATMESTADGILVTGKDRNVIYFNSNLARMWRLPGKMLKTLDDTILLEFLLSQLAEPQAFLEEVRSLYQSLQPDSGIMYCDDGRVFDRFSSPLIQGGEITGRVWSFRDITERIRSETELKRSRLGLAEAQRIAHIGNWEWNIQNNTVYWSDEIYRIFGTKPQELRANYESFLKAVHPDDRDLVSKSVDYAIRKGTPYNIDHRILLKGGQVRFVREQGEVIYDEEGTPVKFIGTVQDITDAKLAEQRLKEYATELEQKNAELQDFAFMASHDLREPLRKIGTFSERLKAHLNDLLGEKGRFYFERIENALVRMQTLLDGLLSYSRITTNGKRFSSVDLEKIVKGVLSDLELQIQQNRAVVETSDLPTIEADPTQMRQLFQNLIANSLKFHKPEISPRISISSMRMVSSPAEEGLGGQGKCQIVVKDNGIGFDEAYLDRIFTIFQRIHGNSEYEGTGIGLAICRKIVQRHGGMITARSKLGEGATFIVTLPIRHQLTGCERENSAKEHPHIGSG